MATTNPIPNATSPSERTGCALLVLLADLPPEQLQDVIAKLASAFPPEDMVIAHGRSAGGGGSSGSEDRR